LISILTFLKYAGLGIAALSSLWSATNVVSKEVDGRKQLTFAGKVAVLITLASLIVSVSSTILEDRAHARAAANRAIAELNQTNRIIMAGQPLASLSLDWKFGPNDNATQFFRNANEAVTKTIENDSQGEVGASQGQGIYKSLVLGPFIQALPAGNFGKSNPPAVILLSLDNFQNAVLAIGGITSTTKWSGKMQFSRDKLAGGVDLVDESGAALYGGVPARKRAVRSSPQLRETSDGGSLELSWSLDPVTLANSIDKQNDVTPLTANLPRELKMLILYEIQELPFNVESFASSAVFEPWDGSSYGKKADGTPNPMLSDCTLELIPNGFTDQRSRYRPKTVSVLAGHDAEYEEDLQCSFVMIHFERVE